MNTKLFWFWDLEAWLFCLLRQTTVSLLCLVLHSLCLTIVSKVIRKNTLYKLTNFYCLFIYYFCKFVLYDYNSPFQSEGLSPAAYSIYERQTSTGLLHVSFLTSPKCFLRANFCWSLNFGVVLISTVQVLCKTDRKSSYVFLSNKKNCP